MQARRFGEGSLMPESLLQMGDACRFMLGVDGTAFAAGERISRISGTASVAVDAHGMLMGVVKNITWWIVTHCSMVIS
jgi:hypothetical protein